MIEIMKSKKFLFGIVVVLLTMISVLPGCNKERQLVIPSSMEPSQIFMEVCNTTSPLDISPFLIGAWSREHMDPELMPNNASEEGFINGVCDGWPAYFYTMRSGKAVDPTSGQIVLFLVVLKYENAEFAEKSVINISTADGLQDSIYKGIALKIGFHSLSPLEEEDWDVTKVPCYLIQSGCFVIYLYGRDDVAKDMLDRIIVAFGVKSSSNQSQAGNTT